MAKVSLRFNSSRMPQGDISRFGWNVQTKVSTDPRFVSIAELADRDLRDALTVFDTDLKNSVKAGNEKTAIKNQSLSALKAILVKIAKEVDIIANGDEVVILAAGFEVQKARGKYEGDPGMVTELTASSTLVEGEVLCKWQKGEHAEKTAFEWEEELVPGVMHNGNYANGSKLLIKGLPSKKWINIRARSLGSANRNSGWCIPVRVFVM